MQDDAGFARNVAEYDTLSSSGGQENTYIVMRSLELRARSTASGHVPTREVCGLFAWTEFAWTEFAWTEFASALKASRLHPASRVLPAGRQGAYYRQAGCGTRQSSRGPATRGTVPGGRLRASSGLLAHRLNGMGRGQNVAPRQPANSTDPYVNASRRVG